MAGVLGEFNAALPSPVTYCKRISLADYERQGAEETQNELEKLLDFLDDNPREYYNALRKRKRDELGVISWLQVSFMSAVQGEEYLDSYFPEGECKKQLDDLKQDLVSAYDYGQETTGNGKRFSKRLAEKRKQVQNNKVGSTSRQVPVPPPPPPPPVTSLKQSKEKDAEDIENIQPGKRKGYSFVSEKAQASEPAQVESPNLRSINDQLFTSMKNVSGRGQTRLELKSPPINNDTTIKDAENEASKLKSMKKSQSKKLSSTSLQKNLNDEITNARKKLRCIYPQGSRNSMTTPYQYSKQQREAKRTPDQYPMFNVALVHKFRNARSPSISPSGCFNDSSSFCNDSPA